VDASASADLAFARDLRTLDRGYSPGSRRIVLSVRALRRKAQVRSDGAFSYSALFSLSRGGVTVRRARPGASATSNQRSRWRSEQRDSDIFAAATGALSNIMMSANSLGMLPARDGCAAHYRVRRSRHVDLTRSIALPVWLMDGVSASPARGKQCAGAKCSYNNGCSRRNNGNNAIYHENIAHRQQSPL
jgi:hypothetical protein